MSNGVAYVRKSIIAFDLDGTLTESKAPLDSEMRDFLTALLMQKKVAVMSGGSLDQIKKQFLAHFSHEKNAYNNLVVVPTSGASMYACRRGKLSKIYEKALSSRDIAQIRKAFDRVFHQMNYSTPAKTYGPVIENRRTQVTFSALGQKAPLAEKETWNRTSDVRPALARALRPLLPRFEVRLGGKTSIDVTKKGIDKAYGIHEVLRYFKAQPRDIVYVGDALYRGGNDAAVKKTRIATVSVRDHEDTKIFIRQLLGGE